MQDFNHATNPNQHAMTPEEVAMYTRHTVLGRAVGAVDIAMNVINLQQPEPVVTEVFQPSTANSDLGLIIDLNQRIQMIHAQKAAPQPTNQGAEVTSLTDRIIDANPATVQQRAISPVEDFSDVA